MSTVTLHPGDLIVLDPSDKRVVVFDWSALNLATGVTISTSTFTISVIKQNGVTALTKDNPSILSGTRKTQVRLDATTATLGDLYELANAIVTSETPSQTKEQSVRILIQNQ